MSRPPVMRYTPPPLTAYALINPFTCKVFYIGATKRELKKRLGDHISDAKYDRGNWDKNRVVKEILSRNKVPLIQELEILNGYVSQYYGERFWIYLYKKVFKHPITNRCIDLTRRKKVSKYSKHYYW